MDYNFCDYCEHEIELIKQGNFYTGYFCENCGKGRIHYFPGGCCINADLTDLRFERSDGIWVRRTGCKNCKSLIGAQKKRGDDFFSLPFLNQQSFLLIEKDKKDCYDSIFSHIQGRIDGTKTREKFERRKFYEDYLKSENWKRVRKLALERDDYLCQGCRIKKAVHVHHTTYDFLGDELLFQLVSLCVDCHQKLHPDKFIL